MKLSLKSKSTTSGTSSSHKPSPFSAKSSTSKPPNTSLKKKSAFNDEDDEDENEYGGDQPIASTSSETFAASSFSEKSKSKTKTKSSLTNEPSKSRPGISTTRTNPIPSSSSISRATLLKQEKAKELDQTVFEYDEVYDDMKEAERKVKNDRRKEAEERKPKYMSSLLESAAKRKLDRLRAEDKMVHREREREGKGEVGEDEEAFVTEGYLKLREEMEKEEEEEKKREEQNAKNNSKSGMQHFYESYLSSSDSAHLAAVSAVEAASANRNKDPESSFKITIGTKGKNKQEEKDDDDKETKELTEAEQAKLVGSRLGKNIEVNEDGQIVDKREMLTGGLNLTDGFLKPTTKTKKESGETNNKTKEGEGKKEFDPSNPLGHLSESERAAAMRGRESRKRLGELAQTQMRENEVKKKREREEEEGVLGEEERRRKYGKKRNEESKVEEMKRKARERREEREKEIKEAMESGKT